MSQKKPPRVVDAALRAAIDAAIEQAPLPPAADAIVERGPFCDWETCGAPLDGPARPGCGSQYIHDGRYKSHPAWASWAEPSKEKSK